MKKILLSLFFIIFLFSGVSVSAENTVQFTPSQPSTVISPLEHEGYIFVGEYGSSSTSYLTHLYFKPIESLGDYKVIIYSADVQYQKACSMYSVFSSDGSVSYEVLTDEYNSRTATAPFRTRVSTDYENDYFEYCPVYVTLLAEFNASNYCPNVKTYRNAGTNNTYDFANVSSISTSVFNTVLTFAQTAKQTFSLSFTPSLSPVFEYDSELGYVTNVRYSQDTIGINSLHNKQSLLNVTIGRYSSTGIDLNSDDITVFYRLVSSENDVGQLIDIFTSNTLTEGLGKVFNITHSGDLAITIQKKVGNKLLYGDTYFIRNVKEGSVGSVLLDNYMRNPDGSSTNLNQNHDGIVNNFDVSNINNAGDTFNDNRSYDQSVTNYNYTTNYNTQNDYNDYNTTNNYPSNDKVNIGPASPEGGGINWLTDINWAKLLESLFSFFTAFLFFVPAVTQVLDFLPFWAVGLIKGLIVAGVAYSVLRGIIYIFREVLTNGD